MIPLNIFNKDKKSKKNNETSYVKCPNCDNENAELDDKGTHCNECGYNENKQVNEQQIKTFNIRANRKKSE
jgi:hypothetical protein